MFKIICSFLSVLLMIIVIPDIHAVHTSLITIDRSPSASPDMQGFFDHIENRIEAVEQDQPDQKITVDYNTQLIHLFKRLEEESPATREVWRKGLLNHATRLSCKHRISGLKLVYCQEGDLSLASALIEPLVASQKLEKLTVTSLCQSTQTSE